MYSEAFFAVGCMQDAMFFRFL